MRLIPSNPRLKTTPESPQSGAPRVGGHTDPSLMRQRRAGSSSGGGGRGGSTGGAGSGKSSSSSSSGKSGSYGYGSRSSGRIKSGLTSGRGARSYHASVGTGLALGAAIGLSDSHCQMWPYSGPNDTAWSLAGCHNKQLSATRKVVQDVCGGNFTAPSADAALWPVVGDNRGVYFAAQNETWANVTAHEFYACLVDNSDAHYGLSDAARVGIGIGSLVGAAVLLMGACMGFGRLRRSRALHRNS